MMRCEIMHPQCRRPNLVQLHRGKGVGRALGQFLPARAPPTRNGGCWLQLWWPQLEVLSRDA